MINILSKFKMISENSISDQEFDNLIDDVSSFLGSILPEENTVQHNSEEVSEEVSEEDLEQRDPDISDEVYHFRHISELKTVLHLCTFKTPIF